MRTRRSFIKVLGREAVAAALGAVPFFSGLRRVLAAKARMLLAPDTPRDDLVGRDPADLDAQDYPLTPLEEFETMGLDDHAVNLPSWRLTVDGHVMRPVALRYEDILAMPLIERDVLLICPGVFANHGSWKGISIFHLLERAGLKEGTTHVTVSGPAGVGKTTFRIALREAAEQKVFLAHGVNGEPLPIKHGFPLRLVAADYYGFNWVKYVDRVTAEATTS